MLVLGAGFVSGPACAYLLRDPRTTLTIADVNVGAARALAARAPAGRAAACALSVDRAAGDGGPALGALVARHALVLSLLPAPFHPKVAAQCIAHGRHLVTASYTSDAMRALAPAAEKAGIAMLNEMGVDPGIDHMSAVKVIRDVQAAGGKVTRFESMCGGLPAPDAATNPLGYKFSWAPRGVLTAAGNPAKWLAGGREVSVEGGALLHHAAPVRDFRANPALALEQIPNRDALPYAELYGLDRAHLTDLYRATMRYAGFCEVMAALAEVGLFSQGARAELAGGAPPVTWRALAHACAAERSAVPGGDLLAWCCDRLAAKRAAAGRSGAPVDRARLHAALEWLLPGVFTTPGGGGADTSSPAPQKGTPLDALCAVLQGRDAMQYAPGERDVVIMRHRFGVERAGGARETITSTMVEYGVTGPDGKSVTTAMSRTVGLTAAIGARLLLDGTLAGRGLLFPTQAAVYEPALKLLAAEGIELAETVEPTRSAL